MMPVVLADDLTGALDAGAQLRALGWRTLVAWDEVQDEADTVLVLDTQTRNKSRQDAVRIIAGMMHDRIIYKKIDSTLRGHVGAELFAALEHGAYAGAMVAPALIEQGRITRGGAVYVHGVPLMKTDLGCDPLSGPPSGDIARVIGMRRGWRMHQITPDQTDRIAQLLANGIRIFIGDAQSAGDLQRLAIAARVHHLLPVGSAGLLHGLELNAATPYTPHTHGPLITKKTLLVNGSPAAHTRRQLDLLIRSKPDMTVLPLRLPTDESTLTGIIQTAQSALCDGRAALLDGAPIVRTDIPARGAQYRADAAAIATTLAQIAGALTGMERLLIIGGDTAYAVLHNNGARMLELCCQPQRQIPLSIVHGGIFDSLPVITKAGAFGQEELLLS